MSNQKKYNNAPLVEIILEIKWALKDLNIAQNLRIDPYFDDFLSEFEKNVNKQGFTYHETIIPNDVPKEFLAGKVTNRFRSTKGKYPLYQVGPGIFTINDAPPYNGWSDFRSHIVDGIENFYKSYPVPEKFLKFEEIQLRYVNFFGEIHGYKKGFLKDHLNIDFNTSLDQKEIYWEKSGELIISKENDLEAYLNFNPAENHERKKGLLVNLISRKKCSKEYLDNDNVLTIIDRSHTLISNTFEKITSSDLKKTMVG